MCNLNELKTALTFKDVQLYHCLTPSPLLLGNWKSRHINPMCKFELFLNDFKYAGIIAVKNVHYIQI